MLKTALTLMIMFAGGACLADGVPEPACPVTPIQMAQPASEPGVSPFPKGPWYINEARTIWAGWDAARMTAGGNKVLWIKPRGAELTITARKLGAHGTEFEASIPCCYPTGFHATGLDFSAEGCWQVSAAAGGEEIRFVTWVRPGAIASGDTLFLHARIAGCHDFKRAIDRGEVGESGEVTLFGVSLSAAGRDTEELVAELADEIGERQGSRPESLEITVVKPGARKKRAELMMSLLIAQRLAHCGIRPYYDLPPELPDYRVALEN